MSGVLAARAIEVSYERRGRTVFALRGFDLDVEAGRIIHLWGPSGTGKSSLLRVLGGLQRPDSGIVEWIEAGGDLYALDGEERAAVRNRRIGFLFQSINLLPQFDAITNVAVPLVIGGWPRSQAIRRADQMLERFGVGHRALHRPHELSGGEQKRVGLARALVTGPVLLLADEPFTDVDQANASLMGTAFDELAATGSSVVLASHVEVPVQGPVLEVDVSRNVAPPRQVPSRRRR